jgi:hypothetical protein
MADAPAPEIPSLPFDVEMHMCTKGMARVSWGWICLAHGDESPMTMNNPFREILINGEWTPIGDKDLTRRPISVATAYAAMKSVIFHHFSVTKRYEGKQPQWLLYPDGSSLNIGCGGRYGETWHEVANKLFGDLVGMVHHVMPLFTSTPVIYLPPNTPQKIVEEVTNAKNLVTPEKVSRLYDAIKRVFQPFPIDQLETRLVIEFNQSQRMKPRPEELIRLTEREQTIWEALGEVEMTAEQLAKRAGYPCNSAFRATLSTMKKRDILVPGANGRGYRRGPLTKVDVTDNVTDKSGDEKSGSDIVSD